MESKLEFAPKSGPKSSGMDMNIPTRAQRCYVQTCQQPLQLHNSVLHICTQRSNMLGGASVPPTLYLGGAAQPLQIVASSNKQTNLAHNRHGHTNGEKTQIHDLCSIMPKAGRKCGYINHALGSPKKWGGHKWQHNLHVLAPLNITIPITWALFPTLFHTPPIPPNCLEGEMPSSLRMNLCAKSLVSIGQSKTY